MGTCTACATPLREGARYCTRCGAPVADAQPEPPAPESSGPESPALEPTGPELPVPELPADPEPTGAVPARIPLPGRVTAPPERSRAATLAFVSGLAPLAISVLGNLVAAQLGASAVERSEAGEDGVWAPVLLTLALVFVLNAGTLTMCAILGARGVRETANGFTRGRGLAIAGLAVGGANLVLWASGLVVTIGRLSAVIA